VKNLWGLITGDDGVGFSSSTETGPETSSSKFRDIRDSCSPGRSNRDAHCIRLPDCFLIRYQGSNRRDYSMPSPFGQRTSYGLAYFRNLSFRGFYRQSRICCYLHLYCFGPIRHSCKARFQACQTSMRYWSQLGSSNPRSCWSQCVG